MHVVIGVVDTPAWRKDDDQPDPEDIRQVCLSAAHCFDPAIAERPVEPIRIQPTHNLDDPPLTQFVRLETGQVAIYLSARGRQWARLAYQFAHEFCHILANPRWPAEHPTMWIEECLCETASLFALGAMARRWRVAPPYRHWADYADVLDRYVTERRTDPDRNLPVGQAFTEWLPPLLVQLSGEPYRRNDNAVIAHRLLPIFEADPETWRAVRYLNLWSVLDDVPFERYFSTWRDVTPAQHHAAVTRIERCLTGLD